MKRLYTVYEIKGFNLDRLINYVEKRGIALYDIKKTQDKTMLVTVKYKQSKNFFAITKELCYNIKKVKDKGRFYPLLYLYKNLGLVIGGLIFLALSVFSGDFVFDVSYTGTGSVCKSEIKEYLSEKGITKYARFSHIDLPELSSFILASNPRLSFVECTKQGNVLKINSVLAEGSSGKLSGTAESLVSDTDGVLENLKIYRGSARVSIGERVCKGQVLVDNLVTVKEQTVKINVLAVAYLRCEYEYVYYSESPDQESSAVIFAEENFSGGEILDTRVYTEQTVNGYAYKVKIDYRRVIAVG